MIEAYRTASEFYAFTVGEIQGIRATASKESYEHTKQRSEDAREELSTEEAGGTYPRSRMLMKGRR